MKKININRRKFIKTTGIYSGMAVFASAGMTGLLTNCQSGARSGIRFFEKAFPRPEIPGAPRQSDVCMRGLHPRPINSQDPLNTLDAIRRFHVTKLEWIYELTPEFIAKVRELGCSVQGAAVNGCWVPEVIEDPVEAAKFNNGRGLQLPGAPAFEDLSILDLNHKPVLAPWMRTWEPPALWGCINNPEMRAGHLRYVKNLVDLGVDGIQKDASEMNHHATKYWGACYCDYCMAGFRKYLKTNTTEEQRADMKIGQPDSFNYREILLAQGALVGDSYGRWTGGHAGLKKLFIDYQEEATAGFHQGWRSELNQHAGRYVPVSANNYFGWDTLYYKVFDYGIRELLEDKARPDLLYAMMLEATELGKIQNWTMPLRREPGETPEWMRLIRQTIAGCYAMGSNMQMPWDTYIPRPDAPRYFGAPKDYADLPAFARGMAKYLDNYGDAYAMGEGIEDEKWAGTESPLEFKGNNTNQLFAFVRAVPGKAKAPVVIHLLDWNEETTPFRLSIKPESFFGKKSVRVKLFTPLIPYNQAAHDRAYDTGDYSALVKETNLDTEDGTTLDIPALAPWGMLVVEPS